MKTIRITEEEIDVPLASKEANGGILVGRGFITGISGSGKSNTAGKICEEILEKGIPLMVIDAEGEYYGLKENFEILHVGADEECDLQVGPEHAGKIAELALKKNIPIILDVSGYIEESKVNELVYKVSKRLFDMEKKLNKPFPVFVEEAHEFIPENGSRGKDGKVTNMLVRIAKRGRKRGLGICALSQRPASVSKNFITQCDYRIWHKLKWDNDRKVVKRVLNKEYAEEVKDLTVGQGLLEAEFLDFDVRTVKFLKKNTFDAGATPDLGEVDRPELKSVSSDLVSELQKISEQKEQEESYIEELETRLEKKDEEISNLEEELDRAQDMSDMAQQFSQALTSSAGGEDSEKIQEKINEIREEKNGEIRDLKKRNEELEKKVSELEELKEQKNQLEEYREKIERWEENKETAQEAISRLADVLDIEASGDASKYRKRLKKQKKRIEELKEQKKKIEKAKDVSEVKEKRFKDSAEFFEDDLVKKYVKRACDSTTLNEEHFWDALVYIAHEGKAQSKDLKNLVDVGLPNIRKILKSLEDNRVLKTSRNGHSKVYRLNKQGVSEIKDLEERRQQLKQKRKQFRGD